MEGKELSQHLMNNIVGRFNEKRKKKHLFGVTEVNNKIYANQNIIM